MASGGTAMRDSDPTGRGGKRAALVTALAAGRSHSEAAAAVGISESTIGRRLREKGFRAEVDAARGVLVELALGRLAAIATRAVDALDELLETQNPAVKVSAARAVLEHLGRLRTEVEIERRLAEVEQALVASGSSPIAPAPRGDR